MILLICKTPDITSNTKGLTIDPMMTVTKQCSDKLMLTKKDEHYVFPLNMNENKSQPNKCDFNGATVLIQFLVPNRSFNLIDVSVAKTGLTSFNFNEF